MSPLADQPDRTAWMSGKYGLMHHWLYPVIPPLKKEPAKTLDEAVDNFDVKGLLDDFEQTGASWLIFTIGQNTGFYASPNPVIDQLAGPGHCSHRDLIAEIAAGVHGLGKRFIAYLPCEVAGNATLHEGFAWTKEDGSDQKEFQQRYTRAIRAWAERFGNLLDGWWFDGCYTWPVFHNSKMDWPLWYSAARAGNPNAAVTFNDGSFCVGSLTPVVPEHDYLSGEAEMLVDSKIRLAREKTIQTHLPGSRFIPGTHCQWHCLLPIDCFWGHGTPSPEWLPGSPYTATDAVMEPPLYRDEELTKFLRDCLKAGGAVTLNIGISQEGYLGKETIAQLKKIKTNV